VVSAGNLSFGCEHANTMKAAAEKANNFLMPEDMGENERGEEISNIKY
jgi:hypothetical protein